MSLPKKIIKVILNVLTYLLLFLLIIVIYGKLVITFGENAYPNYFGYTLFEVASGSMQPTLNINDVVLVKITQKDLKIDDIIAFVDEDTVITHRILYIDENVITVKGDNNNTIDKPILVTSVIGKVVKIFPKLGIWKKVFAEPKILLALFVTLLLFDFALSYNKSDGVEKKKISYSKEEPKKEEKEEEIKEEIKPKEKTTPKDELFEATRKISMEEINDVLSDNTQYSIKLDNKMSKKIKEFEKTQKIPTVQKLVEKKREELKEEEKKDIGYTTRMDLNEIKNIIGKKKKK